MRDYRWTIALSLLSLGFVLLAAAQRDALSTVWGDESTYVAMAESLARDGDLRFTERDAQRLHSAEVPGRDTVILQRAGGAIAYSKSIVYALAAAPGMLLAGRPGLIIANAVFLALGLWAAWSFLRRLGGRSRAALTLATFAGASVLLAHVGWQMSDLLQAALALGGLALTMATLRRAEGARAVWIDGGTAAWLGGGLLGLLVAARLTNLLLVGAAVATLLLAGRARRASKLAGGAVAAFLLAALASQALIGTPNPYRAERATFDAASGYPVGSAGADGGRFETDRATQTLSVKPRLRTTVTAYSTLYFFIGRHTGMLWYFPAALALLATALWRPDRITLGLLAGVAAACAFYLIWEPTNYFGGSTFLGNRYFLPVYPLLLFALPRLPGRATLAIAWSLAILVGASATLSWARTDLPVAASQSHTRAGIFQLAPYESTGRNIDGRRDRYWARDLVRFVQPVPGVGRDSFVLEVGASPREIMLVTRREDAPLLLRYRSRTPGLELVVEHGGERRAFALDRGGRVQRGALSIALPSAWRRHGYWWSEEDLYTTRAVRLSLEGVDEGAKARFWYGGDQAQLEESFDYRAQVAPLPREVPAGGASEIAVRVRNMSPVPWAAEGAFPVTLAYRLWPLTGDAAAPLEGRRLNLPAELPSGDPVELRLPIVWPEGAGRYRLAIDLLIEDYAWFETRLGRPLAEAEVDVLAPPIER